MTVRFGQITAIAFSVALLVGCDENSTSGDPVDLPKAEGVYVVNEGGFGQNNSTITHVAFDGTATQNAYQTKNGATLGDTGNDLAILGYKGYVAVNGSNKVEVVDLLTFESLGSIDLGAQGSPREILIVDSTEAFVTGSFVNKVFVISPYETTITEEIEVGANPEGMAIADDKLFVANSGFGSGTTVTVIDLSDYSVLGNVEVGLNAIDVVVASDGSIYSVCIGAWDGSRDGGVYKIDPATLTAVDSLIVTGNLGEPCLVAGDDLLATNGTKVIKIDLATLTVEDDEFVAGLAVNSLYGTVYSIAYDETTGEIYMGNPKDYTQDGEVVVFAPDGTETARYAAGLNPGTIVVAR